MKLANIEWFSNYKAIGKLLMQKKTSVLDSMWQHMHQSDVEGHNRGQRDKTDHFVISKD